MKWPWTRARTVKDRATHGQKLWFTAVTKDPFGLKAREKRRREFMATFFPDGPGLPSLDALDEQDTF